MINFLGIGAQKCATTWLYHVLKKHPRIKFPGQKEIHFWSYPDHRTLEWYNSVFANANYVNGEITPAYGILSIDVIEKVYANSPDSRLIYLLRNPIDRAWSAAKMMLKKIEMTHDEASDQWFIDNFNSAYSLMRGDYVRCIKNWRTVYPSDQLLIVNYDTIISDVVNVANSVLNHIGVDSIFSNKDRQILEEKIFEGDGIKIRPVLKEYLHSIYDHKIDMLSEYLQTDFSYWKYS